MAKETDKIKLNKEEIEIIKETTRRLFAYYYITLGYNYMLNDIDVFNSVVTEKKEKLKKKLPIEIDYNYCFRQVQEIVKTIRLLRYEQNVTTTYILEANIILRDFYDSSYNVTTKSKKELEKDLFQIVGLISEEQALIQYLINVFNILDMGDKNCSDIKSIYRSRHDINTDATSKISDYLQDNRYINNIFECLKNLQKYLFENENMHYRKINQEFTEGDETTIYFIQSIKFLDKKLLKNLYNLQVTLENNNNHKASKTIKNAIFNKEIKQFNETGNLYIDSIREFYKEQILIKGASFKDE